MKKIIVITVIALLILLAACGSKQMTAKPLKSPTGAVAGLQKTAQKTTTQTTPQKATPVEPQKTAAEAIKELKQGMSTSTAAAAPKKGTDLYPPAPAGVTGKDALKARTKALLTQSKTLTLDGKVDTTFGARYHTKSGSSKNLPSNYGNTNSAGD